MNTQEEKYNVKKHIHLFASWAASRASSTSPVNRFKVEAGQNILEKASVRNFILNPDSLPKSHVEFRQEHDNWREEIISLSGKHTKEFSHGVAAKLINVYLKSIIVCGGFHNHPSTQYIHPPIDSILLKELAKMNFGNNAKFWRQMNKKGWSNFDEKNYVEVIDEIRNGIGDEPLWKIEEYWRGYQ